MSELELSINERVNSQLYSDVVNSYVDINSVISRRNIVNGSYKESVVQCEDLTLANLNSAGGQTIFTRFKLTPSIRNATLAQLAQIYFQYQIPAESLGVILKKYPTENTPEDLVDGTLINRDSADAIANGDIKEHLKFKLFYDTGFSIASEVQLCLSADAKVSTENFNYQQSLLTLNSLPDFTTENSTTESTLKALVENEHFHGVGSGLLDYNFTTWNAATNPTGLISAATTNVAPIKNIISIEGNIDLNKGNPLFHNFPVITKNMGELYLKLRMENFLRELKIVYLNKTRANTKAIFTQFTGRLEGQGTTASANTKQKFTITNDTTTPGTTDNILTGDVYAGNVEYLPYQRLPVDKADFVYLDGHLYKVRLVVLNALKQNTAAARFNDFTYGIPSLTNIIWTRFEMRKTEFDIEDYQDIVASQGKAGVYKFPVHMWRSKNFDQTNAASSSANYLQTTISAPNIDRIFYCEPLVNWCYTFLPTLPATDINPMLFNNQVLPRSEDTLNTRAQERIFSVFTDTDKYSPSADLYNSTNIPTYNKKLYVKDAGTYGGAGAVCKVQRNVAVSNKSPIFMPNKFAYGLELNEGGCFRRGFNSVIDRMYSPSVPCSIQQSLDTSDNIYYNTAYATITSEAQTLANFADWNGYATYFNIPASGAVATVHCLCDYIFKMNFDQFGNLTDFGISEYA